MTAGAEFSTGPATPANELPGVSRVSQPDRNRRDRSSRQRKSRSRQANKESVQPEEEQAPGKQADAEDMPTGDEDEHIVDYLA